MGKDKVTNPVSLQKYYVIIIFCDILEGSKLILLKQQINIFWSKAKFNMAHF